MTCKSWDLEQQPNLPKPWEPHLQSAWASGSCYKEETR